MRLLNLIHNGIKRKTNLLMRVMRLEGHKGKRLMKWEGDDVLAQVVRVSGKCGEACGYLELYMQLSDTPIYQVPGYYSITMLRAILGYSTLPRLFSSYPPLGIKTSLIRSIQYQAHEAAFDPADLAEARKWYSSFHESSLPKGQTTYSRSSGPGGQHVNKRNDSISIQAQTQRSRVANTDENHLKLAEELQKIYKEQVPGETKNEKIKKYEALEQSSRESRLRLKKQQGSKKAFRKGRGHEE
ncbi:hypothetical protein M426DRAFT_23952 [Hypoxylon sp. CI-4A]|nr:hypothetical protein M426DRAFT_23952 [Hypoxylon sp. CI-4A]